MAGTNLYRTPTIRTNDRKFTYSCWFKRSKIESDQYLVTNYESGTNRGWISFQSDDKIFFYDIAGGTDRFEATSNFKLRDTNSWYHLLYSVDTTASSNKTKIYINGVDRYSDFTVPVARTSNAEVGFQKGVTSNGFRVGSQQTGSTSFDGLMSHINFVDGLQLDASAFGETDSTTGEWKIKTSPTVSEYGNNGFFILKDGNSVTDQSGKGNNFGIGGSVGSLTKSEDNPSNVFATYNATYQSSQHSTTKGNTEGVGGNSSWYMKTSSLGASSGKFYAEVKCSNAGGGTGIIGIVDLDDCKGYAVVDSHFGKTAVTPDGRGFAWYSSDGKIYFNDTSTSVFGTWGTNSILMLAMDIDNQKFYIGKDGTWLNSGDPTSGSTGTGAVQNWTSSAGGTWTFADALANGCTMQWNWGNGYFGTTAIASAGTNASGNGIFEYDVPTGYTALTTKGLNL